MTGAGDASAETSLSLREHLELVGVHPDGPAGWDRPEALARLESTATGYALVLSRLHAAAVPPALGARLPVTTPGDLVDRARRGAADRPEFRSEAYRHLPVDRLLATLHERAPEGPSDPLVLTHGSPTLAALRGSPAPTGFAEWRSASLADPHLDLAIATRDLVALAGPASLQPFAAAYDATRIDLVRLDWYLLAIELTPDAADLER